MPVRSWSLMSLLCAAVLSPTSPATAQTPGSPPPLGQAPFSHLFMILERTIFKVDVLALDVCLDRATAEEIEPLVSRERTPARDDSVAAAIIAAPFALGRIRFLRGVSLGQFLGGIRDEQKKAVDAGLLEEATYRMIGDSLPLWFSFLDERGIREDDRITYVFRGDSLRTVFREPDGNVLLDRADVGRQRRTSVLATWFAPGSGFRRPLLQSLAPGRSADPAACSVPAETTAS